MKKIGDAIMSTVADALKQLAEEKAEKEMAKYQTDAIKLLVKQEIIEDYTNIIMLLVKAGEMINDLLDD